MSGNLIAALVVMLQLAFPAPARIGQDPAHVSLVPLRSLGSLWLPFIYGVRREDHDMISSQAWLICCSYSPRGTKNSSLAMISLGG